MPPQVVVLSGGSRGLGKAIAHHLLGAGNIVCTFSRRPSEFIRTILGTPETAVRCLFDCLDVADGDAVQAFVRRVLDRFQRVDALINNAGVVPAGLLAMASRNDIDAVVDVNLRGALYLTRACLRPMLVARRGRIINISSIVAAHGYSGLAAYSATKAGLDAMTRAIAREIGACGITVNSIAPGYLERALTHGLRSVKLEEIVRRTPLGRLGTAADVLPAIDFLLSPGAGFITGHVLVVDGGLTA